MSMLGGSAAVTVDASGAPQLSGSGLALAWAQATIAAVQPLLPALPAVGDTAPPYRSERPATQGDRDHAVAARRTLFEDKVRDANAIAPALVAYLLANAQVDLSAASAQLANVSVGEVPTPNTPGTAISPPPNPVFLPLSGTARLS